MECPEEGWEEERHDDKEREMRVTALALRYRSGELSVLGELYAAFAPFISTTITAHVTGPRRLPDGIDPEDLYQQSYVELAGAVMDWDPGILGNFVPYALGSLPWRIDHYLRSQAPARRTVRLQMRSAPHDLLMETIARMPGPDGRDWDGELSGEELLRKLPANYQHVIRQHLFRGRSLSEIARDMGTNRSSAHKSFKRAIMSLRSMLKKRG